MLFRHNARRRAGRVLQSLALAGMLIFGASFSASAAPEPDAPDVLMRFPTVSADAIAFVAYGNLWTVPRRGGAAVRLTYDEGQIFNPRFSPDGKTIAFTWFREGASDVYVVAAGGGTPRRLTHGPTLDSYDNIVSGWSPDGGHILFLSLRQSPFYHQYETFSVSAAGGFATPLGIGHSGLSSYSADGQQIVYDPSFRNLGGDRWKHYKGGEAPDLFVHDFASRTVKRLTDWEGIDTAPMWAGRRIYFLSDQGAEKRANIWVLDLDTGARRQLTHFTDYDIDMPSLGAGAIVFQQGGKLHIFELATDALSAPRIAVGSDKKINPRTVPATPYLSRTEAAPTADGSAYLVARGDIMRISPDGAAENVTRTGAVAEGRPAVSPDGRTLAYVTDASANQQLAIRPIAGGRATILTRIESTMLYTPRWSPEGRALLIADADHRLWLANANGDRARQVAHDPQAEIRDARFSPDGRWIAYSRVRANQTRGIHLWEVATGQAFEISSLMANDSSPVFAPDGRSLVFISQRRELPIVSDRDLEGTIATLKSGALYQVTLPADGTLTASLARNLTDKSIPVPVELPGGIADVELNIAGMFYRTTAAQSLSGDLPGETSALHLYDPASGRDRVIASDVDAYVIAPSGKLGVVRRGSGWLWVRIAADSVSEAAIKTDTMRLDIDPLTENRAMLDQAWRFNRDLFWDPAMNGVDWSGIGKSYRKLAPLIGSHEDLLYLIGEMQGELSTSHMVVGGGDRGDSRPSVDTALLGVDFASDPASGLYRLGRIYRGDPSRPRFAAPLGNPALDVGEGDYILSIDGQALTAGQDPYALLLGKTGPVSLGIAKSPTAPVQTLSVDPIFDESEIRKLDWSERNRLEVEKRSGGRLGYIYLTDFSGWGAEDFVRQYYPQMDREGLVIDVRGNWGGFTSQWVLDILRRPLAGSFVNRQGASTNLPGAAKTQKLVTVTDMFSRSDSEQFAHYFREYGLGKVVGHRTWGGVRGVKGQTRLLDGTFITVPKDGLRDVKGALIIEGVGVAPDVPVAIGKTQRLRNVDDALDRAIYELMPKPR